MEEPKDSFTNSDNLLMWSIESLEHCSPLAKSAAGYRDLCLQLGFDQINAQEMAVHFHLASMQILSREGLDHDDEDFD